MVCNGREAEVSEGLVVACLAVTRAWSGWAVTLRWLAAAATAVQSDTRLGVAARLALPSNLEF